MFPFFEPIHNICVFSLFTFKPEYVPNISRTLSADWREFSEPSKNIVVSSANWIIFKYSLFRFNPLIEPHVSTKIVKKKEHIMKRYGAIGSPCRQPLLIQI